jgi:hypothetical protein
MQRVVQVLASLAIAIAGLAVHPGTVSAICVFLQTTPTASDVASTPVVFVGRVAFTTGSTAQLTVDEIWRGPDLPWLTTVYGGSDESGVVLSDDRRWSLGTRYLVLAGTGPNGHLFSGGCTATQAYQSSFDALRPADARLQYGTRLGGAIIVLVAGALAFVVWWRRRRRVARSQP